MKLVMIRHGEPDYVHDSLTPKGFYEADLLAERVGKMKVDEVYVSPRGRARATAAPSLEKLGREEIILPWLEEFDKKVKRPDVQDLAPVPWDWLPQDWAAYEPFYDRRKWSEHPVFTEASIREYYNKVTDSLDAFLKEHGYEREENMYRVTKSNEDTIVFFCHFGLTALLLGHLIGVSPMVLWQGAFAAPSSVTTVVTEERRDGVAAFRITALGDTAHLYVAGEEPSFSGRFRECYYREDQRKD